MIRWRTFRNFFLCQISSEELTLSCGGFQEIGIGLVIVPLLGVIEAIAIGKAFGKNKIIYRRLVIIMFHKSWLCNILQFTYASEIYRRGFQLICFNQT